ncbi:SOS response-associated peptidase [Clostridium swellfunianum]|uniref:SOS response-associated peptidase n=1 Tax=Clostridium swellfunianum TaxID=1367462 RepID=UPI00202E087A|nr:SOS response-associated peptidase [Clostridium swellfunianum]MCM0648290.1 SOS response-associated peptidase [Clostridium swellfunianum]
MCGRFFIENDIEDIIASYGVRQVKNMVLSKGEIFPGTNIPVVLHNKVRTLDFLRWGFQLRGMNKEVINARIETASEKPTFRRAFLNNRCIIPANAFFEWETTGKSKVKYKIEVKGEKLFSMAGIYDLFTDKYNKEYIGVVILTRSANEDMSKLHHRMPVIIGKEKEDKWLSGSAKEILEVQEALETEDLVRFNINPAEGIQQLSILDLM